MKIAIVNDMVLAVEALRRIVGKVPHYEIIWIAGNGSEAIAKCSQKRPDLILMDLQMPVLNGVEATAQIVRQFSCAVLIVTASIDTNVSQVFAAMGHGALDVVKMPSLATSEDSPGAIALLGKIATIAKLLGKMPSACEIARPGTGGTRATVVRPDLLPPLVAIAASTGGPQAIATILSQLPKHFRAAIVVVQHIEAQFAPGLIRWLDDRTPLTVVMLKSGQAIEPGKVYIAGQPKHAIVGAELTLNYRREPLNCPYCPSADVLFASLAQNWPATGVGILLTGMGRDGAEGLKQLRDRGWYTIAQSREDCVVYGMPKAAAEIDAARRILPLGAIAEFLRDR
jgi:two-component system response regulator WspF